MWDEKVEVGVASNESRKEAKERVKKKRNVPRQEGKASKETKERGEGRKRRQRGGWVELVGSNREGLLFRTRRGCARSSENKAIVDVVIVVLMLQRLQCLQ